MRRRARSFQTLNWPISLRRSPRSTSGTAWESPIGGRRHAGTKLVPRRPHSYLTSPLAGLPRRAAKHIVRRRIRDGRQRACFGSYLASAPADQALVRRDQRDVRVDPKPAVTRENLHIEMQVPRRSIWTVEVI